MTQSLNGPWRCVLPDGTEMQANIPGCMEEQLANWDIAEPVTFETGFACADTGARSRIVFGAVSYACEASLNGVALGCHEGMWDSFWLDTTAALRKGENTLALRVTKPGYAGSDPYPLRQVLSGFIPDVLCTFGGPWDNVTLETTRGCFITRHSACGAPSGAGEVSVALNVPNAAAAVLSLCVTDEAGAEQFSAVFEKSCAAGENDFALPISMDRPALWQLNKPVLYQYALTVECNGQTQTVSRRFGFREISAQGSRLMLNGKPIYLRGALHWGYNDKRMIPNDTEEAIRSELKTVRDYGFNAVKHCLYIPRDRYLDLMDECGLLAWVELPLWLPEPTAQLPERILREYPRILRQLQGHPSLCIVSLGCELDATVDGSILRDMYRLAHETLPALVRDNSGSGECYGGLTVDYADFFDYHFYAELPNLEPLIETFTPQWRNRRPWMFGEFCDSDTMRDLATIRAARGVERLHWELGDPRQNPICALKPDFYANHHDERLDASGIRAEFALLSRLSVAHSLAHRKVTLELTRSFEPVCGYNVTNLHDVPIASSGLVDALGAVKFDQAFFSTFNADQVLVPAWDLSRVWVGSDRVLPRERYNFFGGDDYGLHILCSNYGGGDIRHGELRYELREGERCRAQGRMPAPELPLGAVTEAGVIRLQLPQVSSPATLWLDVTLAGEQGSCHNAFPIFVYPRWKKPEGMLAVVDACGALAGIEECFAVRRVGEEEAIPAECAALVTTQLDARARSYLNAGGRVVLVQTGEGSLPVVHVPMWREGMFRAYQQGVFAEITQRENLDDLRYFSMTTDVAFASDAIPQAKPHLRRYDCRQWTVSDYMIAFRQGEGRCIATTLRLAGGMGKAACGMQRNPFAPYLLQRMLAEIGC